MAPQKQPHPLGSQSKASSFVKPQRQPRQSRETIGHRILKVGDLLKESDASLQPLPPRYTIVAVTEMTSMLAGMPSLRLTEIGSLRAQAISFFLLAFLISTLAVQLLWNWLRRDFPRLPRLSYRRALGVVTLWGLLFVLVLTMISGARELLTPGAWEPNGVTYRLTQQQTKQQLNDQRIAKLSELKAALWKFAADHGGAFPTVDQTQMIDTSLWESPEVSRKHYIYCAGLHFNEAQKVLAYEPPIFDTSQYVLTTDGRITAMSPNDLRATLASAGDRR